MLLSMSFPDNA